MQLRAWYRQAYAIGIIGLLAIWLAGCGALVMALAQNNVDILQMGLLTHEW